MLKPSSPPLLDFLLGDDLPPVFGLTITTFGSVFGGQVNYENRFFIYQFSFQDDAKILA